MCGGTYLTVDENGNEVLRRDYSHFIIGAIVLALLVAVGLGLRYAASVSDDNETPAAVVEPVKTTGLVMPPDFLEQEKARVETEPTSPEVIVPQPEPTVSKNGFGLQD